jgi:hypothetical protein
MSFVRAAFVRRLTAAALFGAAASCLGSAAYAQPPAAPSSLTIDAADPVLVRKWGIRIDGLRLTAAGYMLDFRYRVVDARKAAPLFARKVKPVLTDEASGARLAVPVPPKTGALRNSDAPKAGRTYFMFFANPGRFVAAGKLVTVTIGDFSVSGIRVDGEPVAERERR